MTLGAKVSKHSNAFTVASGTSGTGGLWYVLLMTPGELVAVKPIRTLPRTRLTHWASVDDTGSLPKLCLCKRARAGAVIPEEDWDEGDPVSCHRCNVTKLKMS